MNEQMQSTIPELNTPYTFMVRSDRLTEAIVNEAIALMETQGSKAAAAYLNQRRVDMDVALRVLSRPGERRRSEQ